MLDCCGTCPSSRWILWRFGTCCVPQQRKFFRTPRAVDGRASALAQFPATAGGLPDGSTISTGPYFSRTVLILPASPTATTCIVDGLMYFLATRCTSSALMATICAGYLSQ